MGFLTTDGLDIIRGTPSSFESVGTIVHFYREKYTVGVFIFVPGDFSHGKEPLFLKSTGRGPALNADALDFVNLINEKNKNRSLYGTKVKVGGTIVPDCENRLYLAIDFNKCKIL